MCLRIKTNMVALIDKLFICRYYRNYIHVILDTHLAIPRSDEDSVLVVDLLILYFDTINI